MLAAELQGLLADAFDLSLVSIEGGELDKLLAFDPEAGGENGGASVSPVTIPEPPRNPASWTGDL